MTKSIKTIKEAQRFLKDFAARNKWPDVPNIDKFDHLHEELIEMSQHLRYKSEVERIKYVKEHKEVFVDGIGDLFFALCRLANQLGVDIEEAFNLVKDEITAKYNHQNPEDNHVIYKKKVFFSKIRNLANHPLNNLSKLRTNNRFPPPRRGGKRRALVLTRLSR